MTEEIDWNGVIDAAHEANEKLGKNIKGRKYSEVSTRVELFRRKFGGSYGIETDLVHFEQAKGGWVVMTATIRDQSGFVVAKGTAQEVVGQGMVNATSAVENCETSAIGRALAVLGLHGGEMASFNEVDAAIKQEQTPPPVQNITLEDAAILEDMAKRSGADMGKLFAYFKITGASWVDVPAALFMDVKNGLQKKLDQMELEHDNAAREGQ